MSELPHVSQHRHLKEAEAGYIAPPWLCCCRYRHEGVMAKDQLTAKWTRTWPKISPLQCLYPLASGWRKSFLCFTAFMYRAGQRHKPSIGNTIDTAQHKQRNTAIQHTYSHDSLLNPEAFIGWSCIPDEGTGLKTYHFRSSYLCILVQFPS